MPLLGAPGVTAMVRVSIGRELYLSFIHSLNRVAIGLPCSGYSVSVRIPKCPKGGIPLHLLLLQPRVRSFSRVATPTLSRKCGGVSASRCFLPRGPCRPLVSPGVRSDRREKAQVVRAEPLNWQAGFRGGISVAIQPSMLGPSATSSRNTHLPRCGPNLSDTQSLGSFGRACQ